MVHIKNSPPIFESVAAALIAVGCIAAATFEMFNAFIISNPAIYVILIAVLVALTTYGVRRRHTTDGRLSINPTAGEFTLNGQTFNNFNQIQFYRSELIGPTQLIRFGQSRMVISLGVSENNFFRIRDNHATLLGAKGNTGKEVDALEALVAGSSLSEDERKSFDNWLGRARIMQTD